MAENRVIFAVPGIDTEDKSQNVEDELEDMDGVMGAELYQKSGETTVRYDGDPIAEEESRSQSVIWDTMSNKKFLLVGPLDSTKYHGDRTVPRRL